MKIWSFPGGVHPPQHKEESNSRPIAPAGIPTQIILPVHQHIGQSAVPIVEVGDTVLKGQMIAKAEGFVSAPLHASTSGKVIAIEPRPVPHPSGMRAMCVVIEPDNKETWARLNKIDDYRSLDPSALRNIIRQAGIVGLGGAGFPTFIKLNPGPEKCVETLIINGVECEPYITCDDLLMRTRAEEVIAGTEIIQFALQAKKAIIAVEDNKPEAIHHLEEVLSGRTDISVAAIPTRYPAGSEKQLVKALTGKEVPKDGLAIHVGVVGQNVATARAVYRAVIHGEPLISRIVTVTGDAVGKPQNFEALIGTPFTHLLQLAQTDTDAMQRLTMGGPMMGFAVTTAEVPLIKTTNCILAQTAETLPKPEPAMPCIRCGACAEACPVSLLPQQLYWYSRANQFDKAQEYNLFDCIECGCCSYVCPSHIPLVQYYRYAKGQIWIKEQEKKKSDIARKRHEARLARLEREKAEREAKRNRKKAAMQQKKAADAARSAREKAMKLREKALENVSSVTDTTNPKEQ